MIATLTLASLGYLRARRLSAALSLSAVAIAVVVVLLALVPFAVSGRSGLFGVGSNDDMMLHLLGAWTLQGRLPLDSSKLIVSGYPIGPHSLAATIAAGTGMSLEHAFTGLIVAVPALLALAAADLLDVGPRGVRIALAAGVGLCYLQAARLVEAAFKEPMEALMLVAFAAGVYQLEQQFGVRLRLPGHPMARWDLAGVVHHIRRRSENVEQVGLCRASFIRAHLRYRSVRVPRPGGAASISDGAVRSLRLQPGGPERPR
jgi:hypothetical protein